MPIPPGDHRLRPARAAVFAIFALNGFLLALWVVHIPVISDRTGIAKSTLGTFILVLAGAALIGMRLAGPLADRFGSRALVTVAGVLISVAVIGPGLATGPIALALALAVFGFGNGALDVSMNTQAVLVERGYGRPIMSAFHGLFSGGGLFGSLVGAAAQNAEIDVRVTLATSAACGLVIVAFARTLLLPGGSGSGPAAVNTPSEAAGYTPGTPGTDAESARSPVGPGRRRRFRPRSERIRHGRTVFGLAAVAFAVLLAEGAAADWSALQMREHLGVDVSTAALAFAAFSGCMTAGRFATDRIAGAFGRVRVVRYGTLLCAAGFAVVLLSPWTALTLTGWALAGLGLSGTVPQVFTAAGNLGTDTAATDMSRVFSFGYLGLLSGPALIGWLTALIPLTAALLVPTVALLVCAACAHVVAPPESVTTPSTGPAPPALATE